MFFVEKFPVFLYNNGNLTDINTEDITMANVKELLKAEENGSLSFGDYSLTQKTKVDEFSFEGDVYKVINLYQVLLYMVTKKQNARLCLRQRQRMTYRLLLK